MARANAAGREYILIDTPQDPSFLYPTFLPFYFNSPDSASHLLGAAAIQTPNFRLQTPDLSITGFEALGDLLLRPPFSMSPHYSFIFALCGHSCLSV
jgi:hypothetical protein